MFSARYLTYLVLSFLLASCSSTKSLDCRTAAGPQWTPVESGKASWYGGRWNGRLTANGERYNQNSMTAAHKSLAFGTEVRVVNLRTGDSCVVRINNRGPFVKGRVIDLSMAAAKKLGSYQDGVVPVRLEVLKAPTTPTPAEGKKTKHVDHG